MAIERSADVMWEGSVARGGGTISAETGAFAELPYSEPTRVGDSNGQTSPEELLAAAHAGCFAMSLSGQLTRRKHPPERLDVRATVRLDRIEGRSEIVGSDVTVRARVPGLGREEFDEAVAAADEGCTFSRLIKAKGDVTFTAELEE